MVSRRPRWPLHAALLLAVPFGLAASSAVAHADPEPPVAEPPAPVAPSALAPAVSAPASSQGVPASSQSAPVSSPSSTAPVSSPSSPAPVSSPSSPAPTVRPVGVTAPPPPHEADKRVGWVATLGILSLPRLVSFEAYALLLQRRLGVGLVFDYLPPGLANFGEDTTLSLLQVGVQGRYFPFANADGWFSRSLYGALGVGYQYSRADSSKFGSEVDYLTESMYFAPKVGLLVTLKSGLTLGGELGASLPLGATTSFASDGTEDSNARKAAKTFGQFVIPTVTLFRIGYAL